jgi:hypothetical protein
MRRLLLDAARARGGVITRAEALGVVPHHILDRAVAAGALERVFPRTYLLPGLTADPRARCLAALRCHHHSALSHATALAVHGLTEFVAGDPVHVTVAGDRGAASRPGLVLHRRQGFTPGPPLTVARQGLEVVRLEQAIVESWPLLAPLDRRAPAIIAVRERRTTPARLLEALDRQPRTSGATALRGLIALLFDGCHSELEIWGHGALFTHPSMPPSRGQVRLRVGERVVYLDRLFDAERVVVELDGAAYHARPGQRERDNRRDAALARLGLLTVRYSHQRLHAEPAEVRAELLEILAVRRRQLHCVGA